MIDKEKFLAVGEKEAKLQDQLLEDAQKLQVENYQFTLTRNEEQGK